MSGHDASRSAAGERDSTSDVELVRRARDGDDDAFAELVRRHERRTYNLAYRILGRAEDAQDATQDAFVSCYRHLGSFRGESAFTTWLHRITVNACYDYVRRRGPDAVAADELPDPAPAADHAERTAAAVDVQRALLQVPIEFRAALVLHDLQGMPYEDVASALDVPVGTVKSRLHRGRLALARALTGEHPEVSAPSKAANP